MARILKYAFLLILAANIAGAGSYYENRIDTTTGKMTHRISGDINVAGSSQTPNSFGCVMLGTGTVRCIKFEGDGSELVGAGSDDMGNHIATRPVEMGNFNINEVGQMHVGTSTTVGRDAIVRISSSGANLDKPLLSLERDAGTSTPGLQFKSVGGTLGKIYITPGASDRELLICGGDADADNADVDVCTLGGVYSFGAAYLNIASRITAPAGDFTTGYRFGGKTTGIGDIGGMRGNSGSLDELLGERPIEPVLYAGRVDTVHISSSGMAVKHTTTTLNLLQVGVASFTVTQDGKVGIRTTDPTEALHVVGNATTTGTGFYGSSVTAQAFVGDGSQMTNFTVPGSSEAANFVEVNASVWTSISTTTMNTRGGRTIVGHVSVELVNASISKDFFVRILRNGVLIGNIWKREMSGNDTGNLSFTWGEASSLLGPVNYTLELMPASAQALQGIQTRAICIMEF